MCNERYAKKVRVCMAQSLGPFGGDFWVESFCCVRAGPEKGLVGVDLSQSVRAFVAFGTALVEDIPLLLIVINGLKSAGYLHRSKVRFC